MDNLWIEQQLENAQCLQTLKHEAIENNLKKSIKIKNDPASRHYCLEIFQRYTLSVNRVLMEFHISLTNKAKI